MELQSKDIGFLVLYFPIDATFSISSTFDLTWSEETFQALHQNIETGKVRVQAEYDGKPYSAIIIQCARLKEHLNKGFNYVVRLKAEKNFPIEKILPMIPRFVSGNKRCVLPFIKVSLHWILYFTQYFYN